MKVLMFGWEYPPHVFGGLATANYGISEGLKAQGDMDITLCLPHPFGDESQHACRIVAMNAVPIAWRDVDYDYVKQRVGNIMDPDYYFKLREHIYADFNYMNVNDLGAMEFAGTNTSQPDLQTLDRIAQLLDMDVKDLLNSTRDDVMYIPVPKQQIQEQQ